MGKLVIISSPSGGGKNAIIRRLVELLPESTRFVTTTTRPPRPQEVEGKDYFFVTPENFSQMIQNDKLIEYNLYAGQYYGSEKNKLEILLDTYNFVFAALDVHGRESLKIKNIPHISIFLLPESLEALEERIKIRGGVGETELQQRMQTAREEMKEANKYDMQVVNPEGNMEVAAQEIIQFLQNQK